MKYIKEVGPFEIYIDDWSGASYKGEIRFDNRIILESGRFSSRREAYLAILREFKAMLIKSNNQLNKILKEIENDEL
jgi:hypothetical protein